MNIYCFHRINCSNLTAELHSSKKGKDPMDRVLFFANHYVLIEIAEIYMLSFHVAYLDRGTQYKLIVYVLLNGERLLI